jgi:D-alanine-D-alanine ligase
MDTKTLLEQQEQESEKPPSIRPRPARPWRVAVIANVKGETSLPHDGPPDAGAEYDRMETIQAIRSAIESDGHVTSFLPADSSLPDCLKKFYPDICFNIAEGIGGDSREAQVPALLEMLHVPYTASRVLANALALDKTMTKRIWRDLGLPTASFQEFVTGEEPISAHLRFPLFVKPAREGTGMGMDSESIVDNEQQLRRRVCWTIQTYRQPALVEDYLPGREFTVGVLGRPDAARYSLRPELYDPDGFHRFPILEVENSKSITPGVYGNLAKTLHTGDAGIPDFICPADVEPELAQKLQDLAIRGHLGVGAVDVSRLDIRLDAAGEPRLLEINSLPGLSPGFSDLCVIGQAEGLTYQDLILEILYLGASRFGLLQPAGEAQSVEIEVNGVVEMPLKFD